MSPRDPLTMTVGAVVSSPIVRRTITLDGPRPRHLGVTVSPIISGDGILQASVCLFTDLTAVVELEEQLRLKEALARIPGQRPSSGATFGTHELSAAAALAIDRGDEGTLSQVQSRDCVGTPRQRAACIEEIRTEASVVAEDARQAGNAALVGLGSVLAPIRFRIRARSRAEECILARRFRGWVEEGVPYAQDHVLDMVPVSWYKAAWLHAFRDMPDFFPLVKERACAPRRRYRRPFGPRKAKLSTVE